MAKRKTTANGGRKGGYEVGYGKPPAHSRFRPGQSGYPAGRRKGLRNLETDVKSILAIPVKVKEGGRWRTRSTQEVAILMLREKALRDDPRALDCLLGLAARFNNEAAEIGPAKARSVDDQAIVAAHDAEIVAAAMTPATAKSPDDPTSKPGGSSDKKAPK